MPSKKAVQERSFTARQVALGTGLESGATVKEAAEAAGISERYAYDLLVKERAEIDEVRQIVKSLVKVNIREIKHVALENVQAELEAQLGTFLDAIRRAATDTDPKTALAGAVEGLNRLLGKPKSTLEVGGTIRRENVALIDAPTLDFLSSIVGRSAPLYDRAKQIAPPIDVG